MQIAIIGVGYVGLVTGACFAEMGHEVICLDIDPQKIDLLKLGILPLFEPGLGELVERHLKTGRLIFTSSYREALRSAPVAFVAVDTPPLPDGQADCSRVLKVAESIEEVLEHELLIITKSTVPPGTTHRIKRLFEKSPKRIPLSFATNPEFLKEGSAVTDCLHPERVVMGIEKAETAGLLREIYAPFRLKEEQLFFMDIISAELTKYAANAMLATRISFMNEMARLAEHLGADIEEVRKGMGADKRIGPHFLLPGIGYGGSCFPKDIRALIAQSRALGAPLTLLERVERINEGQGKWFLAPLFEALSSIPQPIVAVWGLSFKPGTDDLREAPSLEAIRQLLAKGIALRLFDPVALEKARLFLPESPLLTLSSSALEAAKGADAILLVTEWRQFKEIDLGALRKSMRGPFFFDGRNQYRPSEMAERGFIYKGVGRASPLNPPLTEELSIPKPHH